MQDINKRNYYLRYVYRKSDKVIELKRRKKAKAVAYKGGKCESCGGVFPLCVYDLHHINPEDKLAGGSRFLNWNWDRLKEELDKCSLLCANCHRIEHYQVKISKQAPSASY